MSFCPNCGNQLIDGANFCMNCGLSLNNFQQKHTTICSRCHQPLRIETKQNKTIGYCDNCKTATYLENKPMQQNAAQKQNNKTTTNKKGEGISLATKLLIIIFLFIMFVLFSCSSNRKNTDNEVPMENQETSEQAQETVEVEEMEEIEETPKNFVESMSEYSGNEIAQNVFDIYTLELGFTEVEFENKIDGTENYTVIANGKETIVTAMEDYCRIFIPNSDVVFYEDGNVLMTYPEYEDSRISSSEMTYYYSIAQIIIEDCLKSPKSADFPMSSEISYQKKDNLVAIKGYVDAENSFGAEIRSNYVVQFYVIDLENFSYEVTYIEIDGETTGQFIKYE